MTGRGPRRRGRFHDGSAVPARRLQHADRYRSLVVGLMVTLSPVIALGEAASSHPQAVAIIVHPSNPAPDPTMDELRTMWTLKRQFWPNGRRLVLFLPPSNSLQKRVLLARVYEMSGAQLRAYWTAQLFRGAIPAIPSSLQTAHAVAGALQHSEGGMAAVLASEVPPGARVLAIGGKQPGDPNYPLVVAPDAR